MSLILSSKIKEGLPKCLKYSGRLISGADELQKQNEDATAVCLAIIAQEEIGKGVFLLRRMKNKRILPSRNGRDIPREEMLI